MTRSFQPTPGVGVKNRTASNPTTSNTAAAAAAHKQRDAVLIEKRPGLDRKNRSNSLSPVSARAGPV